MDYNIMPKRPNRCTVCRKIIREKNKSKLCSYHQREQINMKRNKRKLKITEYCKNCGGICCGKLRMEIRKGIYYCFCSNCFGLLQYIPNKDIIKILKKNKYGITV